MMRSTTVVCLGILCTIIGSTSAQAYPETSCDQTEEVVFASQNQGEVPVVFSLCNKDSNLYIKAESATFDQFFFVAKANKSLLPFYHRYQLQENIKGYTLIVSWSETDNTRDLPVDKEKTYSVSLTDEGNQLVFDEALLLDGAGPH